ncbi:hypothetical protein D3C80_2046070 [compost metagenome]
MLHDRVEVGRRQAQRVRQALQKCLRIQALATQVEVNQSGIGWALPHALAKEDALAAAGRGAQQAQPAIGLQQGIAQAWTGNVGRR